MDLLNQNEGREGTLVNDTTKFKRRDDEVFKDAVSPAGILVQRLK